MNQCSNAPQDVRQLEPDGSGLVSSAQPHDFVWRTRRSVWFAGREAAVKVYGVAVAMLQEQSWAPRLSNDPRVNVGTAASVPFPDPLRPVGVGRLVASRCRRGGAEDP